jgi:hypothetical protein
LAFSFACLSLLGFCCGVGEGSKKKKKKAKIKENVEGAGRPSY